MSAPATAQSEEKFSVLLEMALAPDGERKIDVGEILDRVADRGFGIVLVLLAIPTMIPILPPGASAVVGAAYAILGLQLLFGAKRPWMPSWVRRHGLSHKTLERLRTGGLRFVRKIERVSKERWALMHSPVALRILGLVIVAIGVLLFLPLPFMNTLPGLSMLIMGVGLATRDGRLTFFAAFASVALIVVAIRFSYLLIWLYNWLKDQAFRRL